MKSLYGYVQKYNVMFYQYEYYIYNEIRENAKEFWQINKC